MSRPKSFHVEPREGGRRWAVRRTGASRARALFRTRAEAWKEGRRLARGERSQAWLHDRAGMVKAIADYDVAGPNLTSGTN